MEQLYVDALDRLAHLALRGLQTAGIVLLSLLSLWLVLWVAVALYHRFRNYALGKSWVRILDEDPVDAVADREGFEDLVLRRERNGHGPLVGKVAREVKLSFGGTPLRTAANELAVWKKGVSVMRQLTRNDHRTDHIERDMYMVRELVFTPTRWELEAARARDSLPVTLRRWRVKAPTAFQ